MSHTVRWIGVGALAVALIVAAVAIEPQHWFDPEPDAPDAPPETAEATTRDLLIEVSTEGSLVYADNLTAHAAIDSPDGAVVTAVVEEDTAVPFGSVLWRLGFEPTVLLAGSLPSHRDLESGDIGADVLQLELNLVALGFDPDQTVTVDDTFTNNTSLMVERWQDSVGAEVTGVVANGAVVYASNDRRVGVVEIAIGQQLSDGQAVLELTELARETTFVVSAADRDTIEVGHTVAVRLPDRSEIPATISSIVVDEFGGATVRAVFDGTVDQQSDNLPVTASWSVSLAERVVAVPESALLRIDSGDYLVQRADGSLVSVTPAASADGWVEVTGAIEPGDLVLAP